MLSKSHSIIDYLIDLLGTIDSRHYSILNEYLPRWHFMYLQVLIEVTFEVAYSLTQVPQTQRVDFQILGHHLETSVLPAVREFEDSVYRHLSYPSLLLRSTEYCVCLSSSGLSVGDESAGFSHDGVLEEGDHGVLKHFFLAGRHVERLVKVENMLFFLLAWLG